MTINKPKSFLENIIDTSIRHRWLVMIMTVSLMIFGIYNFNKLPIDAVPDISNVQVQINTSATGYSPLEVEQRITFPIENGLSGIPKLESFRSLSRYGLSQITVIFDEGTDIYFARQLISERLQQIKNQLPNGVETQMGPIATGLGEIYMYVVEADKHIKKTDGTPYSPMDLLTLQEWVILPQLRQVKGVVEVNSIGGYEQQFHVLPSPEKLLRYDLTFNDVINALEKNNSNVGAGYIEKNGEQYLVRIPGQVKDITDIKNIIVTQKNAQIIKISDVANVEIGFPLRTGAATQNGQEVVLGTVMMLMGENSRNVAQLVAEKLNDINRTLPKGVVAKTVYNRTDLVDRTIATVEKNLLEGALLVVVILFLLLGNLRAAIITATVIPITMLMTITGMVEKGVSGNLMSLGALDFGLIVDGAVIIMENCIARFAIAQHHLGRILTKQERFELTSSATVEVIKPSLFGVIIITVVYLPIFALTGVEGKMFHPMAFTVIIALLSALILSLTFVPAAVALFITGKVQEKENKFIVFLKNIYRPILVLSLNHPKKIIASMFVLLTSSVFLVSRMGTEFIPNLDEGDIAMHAMRIPGTSLTQSVQMQQVLEKEIKKVPEVLAIFGKIGTAEVATDPMPPSVADTFIILKPRKEWTNPDKLKAAIVKDIEEIAQKIPGNNYEFTQPIQMRFNELISGVRSDVAVKIFGDNIEQLLESASDVEKQLKKISGSSDVKIEQVTGLPILSIIPNLERMNYYDLNIDDVQTIIQIAMNGQVSGQLFQGDRRFDIVVRLPEYLRNNIKALENLSIPITKSAFSDTNYIPLSQIANIDIAYGANQISRENGKRRVVITANVRDRDLGGFVEELKATIEKNVTIPTGYWVNYGGTFEQLVSAKNRLTLVIPLVLALILGLLFMAFGSIKIALLIFSGVPFALIGGVFALWITDIPLSISAGIGFIALSGVAVLNGVVMISFIRNLQSQGTPIDTAIIEGSLARLRPILMTALVASLGFVPMALNTGAGSEVQSPLAIVVIGGIISSTILTLIILPTLYRMTQRTG